MTCITFLQQYYLSNYLPRVAELSLINQHLQQQLGESQVTSERLSEDIHRLSVSVTESQTRLREVERDHKERVSELEEQVRMNEQFGCYIFRYDDYIYFSLSSVKAVSN